MRADLDLLDPISDSRAPVERPLRPTARALNPVSAPRRFYRDEVKPAIDWLLAMGGLIFFLPFFVFIAVAVKLSDGGPVIFRHKRIGKNGEVFPCFKFRTMVPDASQRLERLLARDPAARLEWEQCQKLRKDPRITSVGEFLRKTSLDELPQFLNVLRGEMSIIGPRPIIGAEVHHYGEHFADYAAVRPGISGLWQVSGRSDIGYKERVSLDVRYVREQSIGLDFRIMFKTFWVVLLRRGAS